MERGTVEVRSGGASSTHERVVVCAGRGTAALARGVGLSLPMRLGAHVRGTFEVRGIRRQGSPACGTQVGSSAKSGRMRLQAPATAATRWASASPSTCGRTAASSTPAPWRHWRSERAPTWRGPSPDSTRNPSSCGTAGSRSCPGAARASRSGSGRGSCSLRAKRAAAGGQAGPALRLDEPHDQSRPPTSPSRLISIAGRS